MIDRDRDSVLRWLIMSLSVYTLILGNLVPLFGVVFLGWSLSAVILLYWAENIVIGFYNVLKMAVAKGEKKPAVRTSAAVSRAAVDPEFAAKLSAAEQAFGTEDVKRFKDRVQKSGFGRFGQILFFIIHFGGFTLGHGVFVVALFGKDFPSLTSFTVAFLSLFISHGVSYYTNFIKKGEYRTASLNALFFQPYKRIVILHLTIIFGAFASVLLGHPVGALIILIVLKTAVDLVSHRKERARFHSP